MALKVLTVDDSKTIRMIVKKAFQPYNCEVLEAENGVCEQETGQAEDQQRDRKADPILFLPRINPPEPIQPAFDGLQNPV